MAITVTYKSLDPQLTPFRRYVKKWGDRYKYCIQSRETAYDVEQGFCDAEDLPDLIREKCDGRVVDTSAFYACEWPL